MRRKIKLDFHGDVLYMSKTPEGRVKDLVRELLDGYEGMWYYMPVPSGYGRQTVDFLGCFRGLFFAVETKADGKLLTKRQVLTIGEINSSSGKTFIVAGEAPAARQELEAWLNQIARTIPYVPVASPSTTGRRV